MWTSLRMMDRSMTIGCLPVAGSCAGGVCCLARAGRVFSGLIRCVCGMRRRTSRHFHSNRGQEALG